MCTYFYRKSLPAQAFACSVHDEFHLYIHYCEYSEHAAMVFLARKMMLASAGNDKGVTLKTLYVRLMTKTPSSFAHINCQGMIACRKEMSHKMTQSEPLRSLFKDTDGVSTLFNPFRLSYSVHKLRGG